MYSNYVSLSSREESSSEAVRLPPPVGSGGVVYGELIATLKRATDLAQKKLSQANIDAKAPFLISTEETRLAPCALSTKNHSVRKTQTLS